MIYDQSSAQRDDKDFSSLHCRRSRLFQANFAWGEGMGQAKSFGWEGREGEKPRHKIILKRTGTPVMQARISVDIMVLSICLYT